MESSSPAARTLGLSTHDQREPPSRLLIEDSCLTIFAKTEVHKPISLSLTSRQANTKHFKLLPQTTTIASSDPQNNQGRSWDPHWRWGECRAPSQWFLSEAGCGLCWRGEWVVACGCVCGGVGSIIIGVSKNINKQHKNLWKKVWNGAGEMAA